MELTTVTIPKETYEHLLLLGVVSENLPKPKDEMFKCRSTNRYWPSLIGEIHSTSIGNNIEAAKQYSCYSSKESAKEFEKLRKQLAIQFEFNEVYTKKLDCNDGLRVFYPVFCTHARKWRTVQSFNTYSPRVLMYIEVCKEFCRLANLGLIDGLDR